MINVLFVCLGNICRSPIGEATFNKLVAEKNLQHELHADSAGIKGWHIGKRPDPRSIKNAEKHGIELTHLGRKLTAEDFENFDHIVVMDEQNFEDVHTMYYDIKKTPPPAEKLFLIRDYDPTVQGVNEVIDPYYEGDEVFEQVYQTLYRSNDALIDHLVQKYDLISAES